MQKEAILSFIAIAVGEDAIVRMRILANAKIDEPEARLIHETIKRLEIPLPYKAIIDTREDFNVTKQAQAFFASVSHERVATAIVSGNPISMMITNTYVSVFRPAHPTRIFSNEEAALVWLNQFQ